MEKRTIDDLTRNQREKESGEHFIKQARKYNPNSHLEHITEKEELLKEFYPGVEKQLKELNNKQKGELFYNFYHSKEEKYSIEK